MRAKQEIWERLGLQIKIVTFDNDVLGRNYVKNTALPWPLLSDSEQQLYRAYGLLRGSWWTLYGPWSIAKYLWLMLRGQAAGRPGADWAQLGGDVLIGPDGVIRLHFISHSPHERPTPEAIEAVISEYSQTAPDEDVSRGH